MKVFFDHQAFSYQDYGGVSKYFFELIQNFDKNIEVEIALQYSNNEFARLLGLNAKPFFERSNFIGKRFIMNWLNAIHSSKRIKKESFDVLHATYFDPYFGKRKSKPIVITVHDLTLDLYPQYFKAYDFANRRNKEKCFQYADAIIAVSENTKRDVIRLYGVNEEKIHVVHHGYNRLKKSTVKLNLKLPYKYILFVGNRNGYKNFKSFLYSVVSLLKKDPNLFIVCAGAGLFSAEELGIFNRLEIQSQIKYFSYSEAVLQVLYANATVFVFPSLYEGFGMPILEAFSNDCPVALSNRSCFPEIAGNAALYFEPDNSNSIVDTISKIMEKEEVRNELIENGSERLKMFSWSKCAFETEQVYNKILR